ncbi:MAG: general secretion pathway protein GspK [Candidatus Omnitrophota bacterium]
MARAGLKKNSAIILITALWLMVLLIFLALSLGRQARTDLEVLGFRQGQRRAYYQARAGILYALDHIRRDSAHEESARWDTKYLCGISQEFRGQLEDVSAGIPVGEGSFSLEYRLHEGARFGMQDEDSKINLNTLPSSDAGVLEKLISGLGYDEDTAVMVTSAVMDWRDADGEPFSRDYPAEEDFYASQGRSAKNAPFSHKGELRLLRGMTPELFEDIFELVTVFPQTGRFQLNFNTASREVLEALARHFSGDRTNTDEQDVQGLIEKIMEYRNGEDGIWATEDDRRVDLNDMGLSAPERALAFTLQVYRKDVSDHLTVTAAGHDGPTGARQEIEAVIRRDDLAVVRWRQ